MRTLQVLDKKGIPIRELAEIAILDIFKDKNIEERLERLKDKGVSERILAILLLEKYEEKEIEKLVCEYRLN